MAAEATVSFLRFLMSSGRDTKSRTDEEADELMAYVCFLSPIFKYKAQVSNRSTVGLIFRLSTPILSVDYVCVRNFPRI